MAYQDEDENLNRWLSEQASAATPTDAVVAGQPQGQGNGHWAKARELMERQANMKYTPTQQAAFQPEAAPERNDWKTVLAMALGLLTKEGRGQLGNIAMQGEEQYNRRLAQWQERNGPQAQMQQKLQAQQLRNSERQAFNDDRQMLGNQIAQEVQIAKAEGEEMRDERDFDQRQFEHNDSISQQIAGREQQQGQFDASQAQAHGHHLDSMGMQRAQLQSSDANAAASRNQAVQFHRDAMQQHAGDLAHQDAAQQRLFEHQTGLNAADNARALEVSKAAAAKDAADKQAARGLQISEQTETLRRPLSDVLTATKVLKKYPVGSDLPGLGKLDTDADPGTWQGRLGALRNAMQSDEWKADDKAMRLARKNILEFDLRNLTGAGAPEAEKAQEALRLGGTDEEANRRAIEQFERALRLEFQARAGSGNQQIVAEMLKPYGWDWQAPVLPYGVQPPAAPKASYSDIPGFTPRKR